MKRATRNKLLLWIIFLGLLNFAVYTFFYWCLQGDARNGFIREGQYYLRGHFIHTPDGRPSAPVSRGIWIYSFIHSISIWPTIGAVLLSMIILARPHIIATVKSDSIVAGRTLVNVFMFLVVLVTVLSTGIFIINLVQAINSGGNYGL